MGKKHLKYVSPFSRMTLSGIKKSHEPTNAGSGPNSSEYYVKAGVGCRPTMMPLPERNIAPGENLLGGLTNASICLGVDRPGGLGSGYGGEGIPAGTLDLVAGAMGPYARNQDTLGGTFYNNPNMIIDAARVYISQKTDVDKNLSAAGLPEGQIGSAVGKSAVGLKADAVRLVSRDGGIKLVTNVDPRDSDGNRCLANAGIDLIAGGDDQDLQPLVLGRNLLEMLQVAQDEVDDLRGVVSSFLTYQKNFNNTVMTHNHNSPFFGLVCSPSFNLVFEGVKTAFQLVAETETSAFNMVVNKATSKENYFNPLGQKYILSALNNTT